MKYSVLRKKIKFCFFTDVQAIPVLYELDSRENKVKDE
jgi:hypothetical protein